MISGWKRVKSWVELGVFGVKLRKALRARAYATPQQRRNFDVDA
jgi:hypothetical protein